MKEIELSIVATIYNDQELVSPLVEEILKYLIPLNISYEIILVNDYSKDQTETEIDILCKKNLNIKGIHLARNFGQQIAMSAGINMSLGKYILIMDGDFQNPPSAIPILYNEINEGYVVIYTTSKKRNNYLDSFTSWLFWFIIKDVLRVKIVRNQLMLRIFTREVAERFRLYNENIRTIAGIMNDLTDNYKVISIENNKRKSGKSHYSFFGRISLMLNIIISLTAAPLNLMIYLGTIIFLFTCGAIVYELYQFFNNQVPAGYTSMILVTMFFGSLTIMTIGIVGKYIATIFSHVRNRPLYHIRKKTNFL